MKPLADFLVRLSKRKHTTGYKLLSLLGGVVFFLAVLPAIFIGIGLVIEPLVPVRWNQAVCLTVSVITIPIGLMVLAWTAVTQWTMGMGTPAPNAPTQKLVVVGPYRYCRNPIELGAILYYLGIGTSFVSLTTGIVCCLLGFMVGSLYHKLVEEKELELRFGEAYLAYKKRTPFLIPRIRLFP
jgi:protein-S-isoprenylcysteine O-methyltransferase Ste14